MIEAEILEILNRALDEVRLNSLDSEKLYLTWWTRSKPIGGPISPQHARWDSPKELRLREVVASGVFASDLRGMFFIPHGQWISKENGLIQSRRLLRWHDSFFEWRRGIQFRTLKERDDFRIYIPDLSNLLATFDSIGDALDEEGVPYESKVRRVSRGHADQIVIYCPSSAKLTALGAAVAIVGSQNLYFSPPPLAKFFSGIGWCPETIDGASFGLTCSQQICLISYSGAEPHSLRDWYSRGLPDLDFLIS